MSTNPPVLAHTSFTASVNPPDIKPPTSVHESSTASLVPKQATFSTALVSLKVTHNRKMYLTLCLQPVASNLLTSTINSILSAVVHEVSIHTVSLCESSIMCTYPIDASVYKHSSTRHSTCDNPGIFLKSLSLYARL